MPKKLYDNEEQRKIAIKEHKRKCYHKHKELYKLISLRAYYKRKLERDNSTDILYKINELNKKIEDLRLQKNL